jgi:hypothetical protein
MSQKEFDHEDPFELIGMVMPGEPGQLEAMAECLVEEYARMGWDERRLMTLFVNPMFMATYRIYRQKGEAYVQDLIARICSRWTLEINRDATTRSLPDEKGALYG